MFDMLKRFDNPWDCNYVLEGGLAYTEDRIIVQNIFLYKITRKVETEDAKMYFEKFGEITKFRIVNKKAVGRRRGSRVGFVHFKEAKAAAEVLKLRCHRINSSKLIWVKACDSWHQPQGDIIEEQIKENETDHGGDASEAASNELDKTGTIYALDDDCLLIIFKTMRLRDQINFACSHPRFASIFKFYAKLYYKTVEADELEELSLWNIRQFLILAGQFIETFTGAFQHHYRDRIVNFMKVHCPNIRKIKLDTTKLKSTSLRKMISNKPKLIALNLTDCGASDNTMYAISKLTQLESLVISQGVNFTGHYLNSLTNLRKLRLFYCSYLQSSHLIKALSSMPNLSFLDLRGSEFLSKKVFEKLPLCNNLEVLQITCSEEPYENIAKIPKLKHLSLFATYPIQLRMELLRQLVKEKSKQLEFLQIFSYLYFTPEHCEYISKLEGLKKLHFSAGLSLTDNCLNKLILLKELEELKISGCKSITNDGLLEMIVHCDKLKWVNIQNTNIDNDFAKKVIKFLKKTKRPNGRITFLVAGSKMNELSFPEDYKCNDVKSVVCFEFDLPKILTSYDNLSDAFESSDFIMDMDMPFFNFDDIDQSENDEYDSDFEDMIGWDFPFDNFHVDLQGDDAEILFFGDEFF